MCISSLCDYEWQSKCITGKTFTISGSQGSALIEFFVAMIFFVPLITSVPLLGKYFDFKQKNIDSSRYAAWERTVWSDPSNTWNDNEVTKSDALIGTEADLRFFGNEAHMLSNNNESNNMLWRNRLNYQSLINRTGDGERVGVITQEIVSPIKILLADNLAYKGVSGLGTILNGILRISSALPGIISGSCQDLPGIGYRKGMGLGSNGYASILTSSTIKSKLTGERGLIFTNSSSILSNSWSAPSEVSYKNRVSKLVLEEPVSCLTSLTKYITYFPLYKEGKMSLNMLPVAGTSVLLHDYKSSK